MRQLTKEIATVRSMDAVLPLNAVRNCGRIGRALELLVRLGLELPHHTDTLRRWSGQDCALIVALLEKR